MEEKKEKLECVSCCRKKRVVATWIKSLHCKSSASEDVVCRHRHLRRSQTRSRSCLRSTECVERISEPPAPKYGKPLMMACGSGSMRRMPVGELGFPALAELPIGHPSRNVVEIIFRTSWGLKPFPGDVEVVFRVCNLNRTVARFEEYRELVKSQARCGGASDGRCAADGNEMMRFYCLGSTFHGGACDVGNSAWGINGCKTYTGSKMAHVQAGGGSGRRATMVCRVISGRVLKALGHDPVSHGGSGYHSLSRDDGELIVFDSRALLPCFLIIYKL